MTFWEECACRLGQAAQLHGIAWAHQGKARPLPTEEGKEFFLDRVTEAFAVYMHACWDQASLDQLRQPMDLSPILLAYSQSFLNAYDETVHEIIAYACRSARVQAHIVQHTAPALRVIHGGRDPSKSG